VFCMSRFCIALELARQLNTANSRVTIDSYEHFDDVSNGSLRWLGARAVFARAVVHALDFPASAFFDADMTVTARFTRQFYQEKRMKRRFRPVTKSICRKRWARQMLGGGSTWIATG